MQTALWIAQILLAAIFLAAGLMKLLTPRATLIRRTPYVEDLTDAQMKTIGLLEVLGAAGVVLLEAIGVATVLTRSRQPAWRSR